MKKRVANLGVRGGATMQKKLPSTTGGDKAPEYGDDPSSAKLVIRDSSGQ